MNPNKNSPEKAKDFKLGIKKLVKFIRPEMVLLFVGIFLSVCYVGLTILCPKLLGDITNELQISLDTGVINMQTIAQIGIVLIVLYLASNITDYVINVIMSKVSSKVGRKFRQQISVK